MPGNEQNVEWCTTWIYLRSARSGYTGVVAVTFRSSTDVPRGVTGVGPKGPKGTACVQDVPWTPMLA